MEMGFWKKLETDKTRGAKKKHPILVLAPMADVTDAAFRRVIVKYGREGLKKDGGPDVVWTEFVSADGLAMAPAEGKKKLLYNLIYSKTERPIVAQLFGANPERMEKAAKMIEDLGFDGLDINMGCPDRSVEKQGAGAALMKNHKLAQEIIRAAKRGAPNIPISVKTRIGYNKNELAVWLPVLLNEGLAAVTIHARTRKEMSLVPARWEHVKEAVEIRNSLGSQTVILGNGDVRDIEDAEEKANYSGADGVMFGRAVFGNPYLFNRKIKMQDVPVSKRLKIMLEHTKLFEKLLGGVKNFALMKKHYKAYAHGFEGAKELRVKLMEAEDSKNVEEVVKEYLKSSKASGK